MDRNFDRFDPIPVPVSELAGWGEKGCLLSAALTQCLIPSSFSSPVALVSKHVNIHKVITG